MRIAIHPAAFMLGALLLCTTWLSVRTVPAPMPFATAARGAAVPRAQRPQIDVEATVLQRYRGEYRVDSGLSVFIAVEGTRLFALAPDTPKLELLAFSATQFVVKDVGAEVTFDVRGDEPARGFTAEFPGATLTAKRVGR